MFQPIPVWAVAVSAAIGAIVGLVWFQASARGRLVLMAGLLAVGVVASVGTYYGTPRRFVATAAIGGLDVGPEDIVRGLDVAPTRAERGAALEMVQLGLHTSATSVQYRCDDRAEAKRILSGLFSVEATQERERRLERELETMREAIETLPASVRIEVLEALERDVARLERNLHHARLRRTTAVRSPVIVTSLASEALAGTQASCLVLAVLLVTLGCARLMPSRLSP